MKFKQGKIVCYKTSNGQTISGMVTNAQSMMVQKAQIEMFEVLFQDGTNSRGTYLSRMGIHHIDDSPEITTFIFGDTTAPATVEIADDC